MGRKTTANRAMKVALVNVDQGHRMALQQACVAAGCPLVFKTINGKSTDRLGQWADIVVVEADRGFGALHSAQRARRAGASLVGVLVNWWSDLEWDAHQVADFVLHVPPSATRGPRRADFHYLGQAGDGLARALAALAARLQGTD